MSNLKTFNNLEIVKTNSPCKANRNIKILTGVNLILAEKSKETPYFVKTIAKATHEITISSPTIGGKTIFNDFSI